MLISKKVCVGLIFITAFLVTPVFFGVNEAKAETSTSSHVLIELFYSTTCPHCQAELSFLNDLKNEYENKIEIEKHIITKKENQEALKQKLEEKEAMNYFGTVPITFVNGKLFIGFGEKTTGEDIIKIIEGRNGKDNESAINIPFLGKINTENYSLPALAVILGFLDGFNVCSLGALALILGLVLTLRSRKKILLYGGSFVLITSIIYGVLIILWQTIFSLLSNYILTIEALVAVIGIIGGIFFFKEFRDQQKYGPACNSIGSRIVSKLSTNVNNSFKNATSLGVLGSILAFASVITIVEFPCSAATPVAFSAILASSDLSSFSYLLYIAIFVLFYMLDEIIILIIAAYKMELWIGSGKFTKWAILTEGIILTLIGLYYLNGFLTSIF